MAEVTGYTADRMKIIEDASVVDGEVVGDNLILTRYDASTINAGNVRGATGSPGISSGDFNAGMDTLVSVSGDTLTGQLNGISPVAAANLTRKDYVDAQVALKISKTGDTLSGPLNGVPPSAAAHLTRKDYVDSLNAAQTVRIQAGQQWVALSNVANNNKQFSVTFPVSYGVSIPVVTFTAASDFDDPIGGYEATIAYRVVDTFTTGFQGLVRSINDELITTTILINWIAVLP